MLGKSSSSLQVSRIGGRAALDTGRQGHSRRAPAVGAPEELPSPRGAVQIEDKPGQAPVTYPLGAWAAMANWRARW